jgi:hypothetical protein
LTPLPRVRGERRRATDVAHDLSTTLDVHIERVSVADFDMAIATAHPEQR